MRANPSPDWFEKAMTGIRDVFFKSRLDGITYPNSSMGLIWRVPVHYGDGRHYAVQLPVDIPLEQTGDTTLTREDVIRVWADYIEQMRKGGVADTYESYLERLGIRVRGHQRGAGQQLEMWARFSEFVSANSRFDTVSQEFRAFLNGTARWNKKLGKFAREPGYVILLGWVRPSFMSKRSYGYHSAMRKSLFWQPDLMSQDIEGFASSHVDPQYFGYGAGDGLKLHAHMPHVVGESLVGDLSSNTPDIGAYLNVSGNLLEQLYPSLSTVEAALAGTGQSFDLALLTNARPTVKTTCAWPFHRPWLASQLP